MALGGCTNPPAEGVGAPVDAATAAPTSAGGCPASGVAVEAGPVDAAMGFRAVTLTLVNCGSAPYALEDYPGIGLLDEERQAIAVQVLEEPDPIGNGAVAGPASFTVAPGEQARTVLTWRNTVELGLPNTPGSHLEVTPSPGGEPQVVELSVDLGTTGRLTVGPWTAA